MRSHCSQLLFFFFNDTATTEIYTLSLHDALPISSEVPGLVRQDCDCASRSGERMDTMLERELVERVADARRDRKSTRLNSSHLVISYAVFCLKNNKKDWP